MRADYNEADYFTGHQAHAKGEPLDKTKPYWWQFGWKEAAHQHMQDSNPGGPDNGPEE